IGRPWKNLRRRKAGWSRRNAIIQRLKARGGSSIEDQSTHDSSLSWQYALLLPFCVLPSSSPPTSIGTPWAVKSVVRKLRCWRARHLSASGSSVSPSAPQFHDRLCDSPSAFCSPFASLCFALYETRSRRVKPSWAVTKLTLAKGRRVSFWYRSELPVKREANSA